MQVLTCILALTLQLPSQSAPLAAALGKFPTRREFEVRGRGFESRWQGEGLDMLLTGLI